MRYLVLTKISIFLLLFTSACQKLGNHPVPNVPVSVQINIMLPSYSNLQSVGGYAYVNGGVKGLIVYRSTYDQFVCYDRMSTADGGDQCFPLEVDPDNFLFLNDSCSDAVYSLLDGSVVSGSAVYPLKAYQTNFDGFSILYITN
ncbi:MAG: hypothetical protein KDC84_03955 [Crocinitomicaceae bacterium]|nr:hypothetical protein [Crocinitomicaceae bacterium]